MDDRSSVKSGVQEGKTRVGTCWKKLAMWWPDRSMQTEQEAEHDPKLEHTPRARRPGELGEWGPLRNPTETLRRCC